MSPASFKAYKSISPVKPSEVFDTYWKFAVKRQDVFFERFAGKTSNLTNDPILTTYKFTNAYRASDRVSQYLIRNVIYEGSGNEEEVFFRIMLFKLFNKIETWELLKNNFGELSLKTFSVSNYNKFLSKEMNDGRVIYSNAYMMSSGAKEFDVTRKHHAHLLLIKKMLKEKVPNRIIQAKKMSDAFLILREMPLIGDFLAYQFITDINYSELTNYSEMEFTIPGPGAKDGIKKCFTSMGGLSETEIIRMMTERQEIEFSRLGLKFKSLGGRPLQLIDIQNLFCEVDKYARVAHPHVQGKSGRTRIKQRFTLNPSKIEFWYPPKWGINDKFR